MKFYYKDVLSLNETFRIHVTSAALERATVLAKCAWRNLQTKLLYIVVLKFFSTLQSHGS
jgi:hypothetical protein